MTITPAGTPMGMTVSQWCDQLRHEYLDPHGSDELDQVDGALLAADTTVTVVHGASGLRAQNQIEIGDELLHLWGPGVGANKWTVARGFAGSTATGHADRALVRVNPRWPRISLARQLHREIRHWPAAVCAVVSGTYALAPNVAAIDLDGLLGYQVTRILSVQRAHHDVSNVSWPLVDARLEVGQDRDYFPSGWGLRFPAPYGAATSLRVVLGIGFKTPVPLDLNDDLGTDYLLSPRLADAAMLGVAGRLLVADELGRTDQSSQRRSAVAEEVPPGHRMQAGQGLLAERDKLLKLEAEDIYNAYAVR